MLDRVRARRRVDRVGFWWHSIDFGDGVVSDGKRTPEELAAEWAALELPALTGKTVLDVGAWDGYFSFQAEEHGAARVVALDHYVWSLDLPRQQQYWRDCRDNGTVPEAYESLPELWRPGELPGKAGFDTAHRARGSRVESVVGDFMTMDLDRLGTFDVVLYLGVLYHMQHPLQALQRVAAVTRELAVIETHAVLVPGQEHRSLCEFYEADELNGDVTNWWGPNQRALVGMCRAAGFRQVETVQGPPDVIPPPGQDVVYYRAVVHAWK
jgi:tRNA (mo5U34)-methyltransferase